MSRLEGAYKRLSTKANIGELQVDLIKWVGGLMVESVAAASSMALFVQRFIG